MGFDLRIFEESGGGLDPDYVEWLIDEYSIDIQAHFARLWEYYTNPMYEVTGIGAFDRKVNESGRCYIQAQEYGLPARITGLVRSANVGLFGARPVQDVQRKEVVIENDIAWRINAAVDFLFGKPITLVSKSPVLPHDIGKLFQAQKALLGDFEGSINSGFHITVVHRTLRER
jgi:hypothetical protein